MSDRRIGLASAVARRLAPLGLAMLAACASLEARRAEPASPDECAMVAAALAYFGEDEPQPDPVRPITRRVEPMFPEKLQTPSSTPINLSACQLGRPLASPLARRYVAVGRPEIYPSSVIVPFWGDELHELEPDREVLERGADGRWRHVSTHVTVY